MQKHLLASNCNYWDVVNTFIGDFSICIQVLRYHTSNTPSVWQTLFIQTQVTPSYSSSIQAYNSTADWRSDLIQFYFLIRKVGRHRHGQISDPKHRKTLRTWRRVKKLNQLWSRLHSSSNKTGFLTSLHTKSRLKSIIKVRHSSFVPLKSYARNSWKSAQLRGLVCDTNISNPRLFRKFRKDSI